MQQRLRLYINLDIAVLLIGVRIDALEEESSELVTSVLARSCAVQHFVDLSRCAIVFCMLRVTKLVCVAVQVPRRCKRLIRSATVNNVHQIGVQPFSDNLLVLTESPEDIVVLDVLI